MVAEKQSNFKWGMAVDIDKCNGCQACVIACQSENNIPINTEDNFKDARGIEWIRVERYWEGEFPNVKAKFIPILFPAPNPIFDFVSTHFKFLYFDSRSVLNCSLSEFSTTIIGIFLSIDSMH